MFTVESFTAADGSSLKFGVLTPDNAHHAKSGKALLFLPGLGGSVKGALNFLETLLPYYDAIYGPDLRGFGMNPVEVPLPSPQIILEDLETFQSSVLAQRHSSLDLAGISLGGVLATLIAVESPQAFEKLLLLAPAYKSHTQTFTPFYVYRSILGRLFCGKEHQIRLPYSLKHITRNTVVLEDPQFTQCLPLSLKADFLLGVRSLCEKALKNISKIKIPTMVVIPGQDVVCDPTVMYQGFQKIPGAIPKICREYPDLYHDVLMETECKDIAQDYLNWAKTLEAPSCEKSF